MNELDSKIINFISNSIITKKNEFVFNKLALEIFSYQFENNYPYKQFCLSRDKTPKTVRYWRDIPAVPTEAFKEIKLISFPADKTVRVFRSSGTTFNKRGEHFLETLEIYNISILENFKIHLLPDAIKMDMAILVPSPDEAVDSSLSYMMGIILEHFGSDDSRFFIQNGSLQFDSLSLKFSACEQQKKQIFLLGTAFSFVHLFNWLEDNNKRFKLPNGSRVMETGGFKGKVSEITKADLYQLFDEKLGISMPYIVNEYGMCELGTQYYDNTLRNAFEHIDEPYQKTIPPWARVLILDPETLVELPKGERGLICHWDLTNRGSIIAVQTSDIGIAIGDGFEILGRAKGAEAKGCSLMLDEMLGAIQ